MKKIETNLHILSNAKKPYSRLNILMNTNASFLVFLQAILVHRKTKKTKSIPDSRYRSVLIATKTSKDKPISRE